MGRDGAMTKPHMTVPPPRREHSEHGRRKAVPVNPGVFGGRHGNRVGRRQWAGTRSRWQVCHQAFRPLGSKRGEGAACPAPLLSPREALRGKSAIEDAGNSRIASRTLIGRAEQRRAQDAVTAF